MSEPERDPTIASLTWGIYVPALLLAIGQGAVLPIVALTARDLGASVALAGVIVGVRGIGTLVFDLPAGSLVGRVGERRALLIACALIGSSSLGAIASSTPTTFAVAVAVMGCGRAVWLLARQAYVTEVMPAARRGRALSTLGGINRIGNFIGPFVGAAAVTVADLDAAYWLYAASALAAIVLLVAIPDPHALVVRGGPAPAYRSIVADHARTFLTVGGITLVLGMLRVSRQAVLPLWAEHIGLDEAAVGVVFGISAAIDMTLFYPVGSISDRRGRRSVAVPCLALMATGFLFLPLTDSFTGLVLVGALLGFGNGLGSGIVMTLGSDFSPDVGRAEFLGVWRLVGDIGQVSGPFLVAAVVSVASLGPASILVGGLGVVGAGLATRFAPGQRSPRTTTAP